MSNTIISQRSTAAPGGVIARPRRRPSPASAPETAARPDSPRRCHDCGAPTSDYRCPKCLRLWRIKHHVDPEDWPDV